MDQLATYTAFAGRAVVAAGSADDVVAAVGARQDILIFSDRTGERVELDGRTGRLALRSPEAHAPARAGRGRPKLGVVAREVTLLPRHWEWLSTQPGGASATLRRLVDEARTARAGADHARQARQAVY